MYLALWSRLWSRIFLRNTRSGVAFLGFADLRVELIALEKSRLRSRLDASAGAAAAAIDLDRLADALSLLDRLCRQFVREALKGLDPTTVVKWHHKLLLQWCAGARDGGEGQVDGAAVERAHAGVAPEVALASRCGPHLRAALQGTTAYQELLFPGGSMETVLPVYEDAVTASFYNGCVVAVVEVILALPPGGRRVVALEVGAGSGGTASSVMPVLEGACERYVFTDVSEVFLRQARVRDLQQERGALLREGRHLEAKFARSWLPENPQVAEENRVLLTQVHASAAAPRDGW